MPNAVIQIVIAIKTKATASIFFFFLLSFDWNIVLDMINSLILAYKDHPDYYFRLLDRLISIFKISYPHKIRIDSIHSNCKKQLFDPIYSRTKEFYVVHMLNYRISNKIELGNFNLRIC